MEDNSKNITEISHYVKSLIICEISHQQFPNYIVNILLTIYCKFYTVNIINPQVDFKGVNALYISCTICRILKRSWLNLYFYCLLLKHPTASETLRSTLPAMEISYLIYPSLPLPEGLLDLSLPQALELRGFIQTFATISIIAKIFTNTD